MEYKRLEDYFKIKKQLTESGLVFDVYAPNQEVIPPKPLSLNGIVSSNSKMFILKNIAHQFCNLENELKEDYSHFNTIHSIITFGFPLFVDDRVNFVLKDRVGRVVGEKQMGLVGNATFLNQLPLRDGEPYFANIKLVREGGTRKFYEELLQNKEFFLGYLNDKLAGYRELLQEDGLKERCELFDGDMVAENIIEKDFGKRKFLVDKILEVSLNNKELLKNQENGILNYFQIK